MKVRLPHLQFRTQVPAQQDRQERNDQGRSLPEGAGQRDGAVGRHVTGDAEEEVEVAAPELRSVFHYSFEQIGLDLGFARIARGHEVIHLVRCRVPGRGSSSRAQTMASALCAAGTPHPFSRTALCPRQCARSPSAARLAAGQTARSRQSCNRASARGAVASPARSARDSDPAGPPTRTPWLRTCPPSRDRRGQSVRRPCRR